MEKWSHRPHIHHGPSAGLHRRARDRERRPAAIGGWAGIGAVGAASGPPPGGLLTSEIRDPDRPPLPDWLGTVLPAGAVAVATLGLVNGDTWNWDGRVIGCFAAAVLLPAAFVIRSQRHRAPVELSILRVPAFALASLSATLFFASFSVMLLGNVCYSPGGSSQRASGRESRGASARCCSRSGRPRSSHWNLRTLSTARRSCPGCSSAERESGWRSRRSRSRRPVRCSRSCSPPASAPRRCSARSVSVGLSRTATFNENAPVPAGYEAGTRGALEGGEVLHRS